MLLDVSKSKGEYKDKVTGQVKKCTHFYLTMPNGRHIQIRTAFKEDVQKLDWIIPLDDAQKEEETSK